MGVQIPNPIPLKSLPAPIARLLPTLLDYVRTSEDCEDAGPEVRQLFVAHVRAMKAFLKAMGEATDSPRNAFTPLVALCGLLIGLKGTELAEALTDLIEKMQTVYWSHRKLVRRTITNHPYLFGDLYRGAVSQKRVVVVHAAETWSEAESLGVKLTTRCWYDHRAHHERDGVLPLVDCDLVLFAPGMRPIRTNIEEAIVAGDVPIIVLGGLGETDDPLSMAALRTDHRYRQKGYRVLRKPFSAVRLYQAIDGAHLRHLARVPMASLLEMIAAC